MPLTLPTHPVAVLPLKLRWPRRIDGVAAVVGGVVPDLAYAADGYGVTICSHAWHALLWWALPLTLVATRLIRWAAPAVAAHLPASGPLHLRDYAVLARYRHGWLVTAYSGLLGAASHLVWDAFTHPYVDGGRLLLPALHQQPLHGLPWWYLLSRASDAVGLVAGAALLIRLGRYRLLRAWHGTAPAVTPRPARFWPVVAVALAAGLATLPLHPARTLADQAIRCLLAVCLALLAGAAAAGAAAAGRPREGAGREGGTPVRRHT